MANEDQLLTWGSQDLVANENPLLTWGSRDVLTNKKLFQTPNIQSVAVLLRLPNPNLWASVSRASEGKANTVYNVESTDRQIERTYTLPTEEQTVRRTDRPMH